MLLCLVLASQAYSYVPSIGRVRIQPLHATVLRSSNDDQFTVKDIAAIPFNGVVKSKLWGLYSNALSSKGVKSVLTKVGSSFIAFLLGDMLSQLFTSYHTSFNWVRFFHMGVFGGLVHAPAGHVFYRKLEKLFPGNDGWAIAKKLVIDQFLYAPLFAAIFFMYHGVAAGFPLQQVIAYMKVSKVVLPYISASALIWPVAHLINYKAIPPNKRLLFINMVQLYFNTIVAGLAAAFVRAI